AVVALAIDSRGWTGRVTSPVQSAPPDPSVGQLEPGAVTEARLGSVPDALTSSPGNGTAATATRCTVALAPAARSPIVQVTLAPPGEVPPSGDDTTVSPAGSTSRTTTPVAPAGVPLVTVTA